MNKFLRIIMVFSMMFAVGSVYASTARDNTFNVYGVGAKTNADQSASSGIGVMYDSENVKVKIEGTSDFVKSGAVLKFNPYNGKWYMKVGANYIHQKMYAPDDKSDWVSQTTGALSAGYMVSDDMYVEIGGSSTSLSGTNIGTSYVIDDETTNVGYVEVAKRWETSIGTLDTTANAGVVDYKFKSNENSYGVGLDYYPSNNVKFGYNHQYEQNNIVSKVSTQYGMGYAEYADNRSFNTYQATVGIKVAFDNLFDVSTWKSPTNIKSHLSELHRFEGMTFGANMQIQSSKGVQSSVTAPANGGPTWTSATIASGVTVNDTANTAIVIQDLSTVSSDAEGDTITYSIVSITGPFAGDQTAWNNSVNISGNNLQVQNLLANNPTADGTISVVVRGTATGGTSDTTVTFTFTNVTP